MFNKSYSHCAANSWLKGLLLIAFFYSSQVLLAQERFSLRYDSGFQNTLFMSVIEVEYGYVVTGFLGVEENNSRPILFATFDFEGSPMSQREFGNETDYFSSQNPDLTLLNDSTLIHSGISFLEDGTDIGYIAKFNLDGDTLELLQFSSPQEDPEYDWFRTTSVKPSTDGNLFMLSTITQPLTDGDFIIRKIDTDGNIIWEHIEATEQANDICRVMLPTDDGGVITVNKLGLLSEPPDDHHFFKLNANTGDIEWEQIIDAPSTSSFTDGVLQEDKYVFLAPRGYEPPPSNGYFIPTVIAYDLELNELWQTDVWPEQYHYNHGIGRIKIALDGNIVVSGWRHYELDEPTETSGDYNDLVWLAKLDDETGELLWVRYYQYLDLPFERHSNIDMRPTSDGGFILCGESTDIWPSEELTDPPYQQGWLLKLDEYGCLVEDCYLSVLENENSENKYFAVGPNPATDYLHIRMCALEGHNCRLRVHDLQGNLCYESPSGMYHNSTLTLSIEQWVKATYVLSMVSENGRVVQSELVVVQ